MKGLHPNWRHAVVVAGIVVFAGGGCRNQPTATLANPFMAPERVPPPATRALAPGSAQPYYPGDPLPVMQSATAPPPAAVASASAVPTAPPTPPTNGGEITLAAAQSPPVTIPVDNQELRFALPPPTPPAAPPVAPPTPAAPVQLASVPPAPAVQPALYTGQPTPVTSRAPVESYAPVETYAPVDPTQLGPWRSPRIASPGPSPAQPGISVAPPSQPSISVAPSQPNIAAAPNQPSMPVRLRPVPSPTPVASPPPRIRLPGHAQNSAPIGAPVATQQAVHTSPDTGSVVQTVRITELPPFAAPEAFAAATGSDAGLSPHIASQPAPQTYVSSDGFRPRGSTR